MSDLDENDPLDDVSRNVLGGLEQLAGGLDARKFPGRAWPASRAAGPAYRVVWKLAASIAAAVALVAVLRWANPPLHVAVLGHSKSTMPSAAQTTPAPFDRSSMPRIVIVEDMDSYSIIDMTGDVPLVSFARRDSDGFDDAGPVFVEPTSFPTTKDAPL